MLQGIDGAALDAAINRVAGEAEENGHRNAFGFAVDGEGVKAGIRWYLDDAGSWQAKAYAGLNFDHTKVVGVSVEHTW